MNRISIVGLNSEKTLIINSIMDLGAVEINSQDDKLTDPEWIPYVKKDNDGDNVFDYDQSILKVSEVISCLEKYDTTKKPLFNIRKNMTYKEFNNKIKQKFNIEENVTHVLQLTKSLNELSAEENKAETVITSLSPWAGYDIPLELSETKYTFILTGVVPTSIEINKLRNDLEQQTDKCHFELISSDKDQHYISIIGLMGEKEEVLEMLKQYGFNNVAFNDLEGTAARNIAQCEKKLKEISCNRSELENKIKKSVVCKEDIQILYDHMVIERDKIKILDNILKTNSTFYIEGWVPQESMPELEKVLNTYRCWYEASEPAKGEEYPVLLHNNRLVEPLEAVTELYSLPSSSNVDPTSSMWFFFVLFFGMMLGDVGYGLILVLVCGLVVKKFKVEGTFGKMLKTLFYAGISTIFWGVMFGSWFGDGVVAGAKVFFNIDLVIKPLWLNPLDEPMTVLIVSFAFGIIHLFVGLGVKAYILIRDGMILDAIFDVGFWYLFIIGPVMLLIGDNLATEGKYITIIGAVGLVLTQGREKKGIISKLFGGIMSLYDITGYLSDVLSYSRLLALGLATGVISSVLSIIGSMGGHSFFGAILFIVVFVLGHLLNFAINALGSFVHSARLQYVEYFGKFYEGGGEAFNPLMKKTKYIKIVKEEN